MMSLWFVLMLLPSTAIASFYLDNFPIIEDTYVIDDNPLGIGLVGRGSYFYSGAYALGATRDSLDPPSLADLELEEYHDILKKDVKEWRLVFRGTANVMTSMYDAYVSGAGIPDPVHAECKSTNFNLPCHSHYRNKAALEDWVGVKDVLVGIVNNGSMVKTIMFNGKNSTMMNFFRQENVLDSCFLDLKTQQANIFSIEGFVSQKITRRFYLSRQHGGCGNDAGWLSVVDRSIKNTACVWDDYLNTTFPIIKYSSEVHNLRWQEQADLVKEAEALVIFVRYEENRGLRSEYHDILNTGVKEYRLAFRGTADIGVPLLPAYLTGAGVPATVSDTCKTMDFSQQCLTHYRNNDALTPANWHDIEEIFLGIVHDDTIVKYIKFNGLGTSFDNFFQQKFLNESLWRDLETQTKKYFSMTGDDRDKMPAQPDVKRHFFISNDYKGCEKDDGWFVTVDNPESPSCSWEKKGKAPLILYSASPRLTGLTDGYYKRADAMVILLKYRM